MYWVWEHLPTFAAHDRCDVVVEAAGYIYPSRPTGVRAVPLAIRGPRSHAVLASHVVRLIVYKKKSHLES